MIVIGLIMLVLGYILGIGLLQALGWIFLGVGLVLLLLGAAGVGVGGPVGGRWW